MYFIYGDKFIMFFGEIYDFIFGDVDVFVNIICCF